MRWELSEAGYSQELVPNVADGQYMAIHGQYDLAILDVMLRGLSGWQVLQSLRNRGLEFPCRA